MCNFNDFMAGEQVGMNDIMDWTNRINEVLAEPGALDTLTTMATLDSREAAEWLLADTRQYLETCSRAARGEATPEDVANALRAYMVRIKEAYDKFLFRQMSPEQITLLGQMTDGYFTPSIPQ